MQWTASVGCFYIVNVIHGCTNLREKVFGSGEWWDDCHIWVNLIHCKVSHSCVQLQTPQLWCSTVGIVCCQHNSYWLLAVNVIHGCTNLREKVFGSGEWWDDCMQSHIWVNLIHCKVSHSCVQLQTPQLWCSTVGIVCCQHNSYWLLAHIPDRISLIKRLPRINAGPELTPGVRTIKCK